MVERTAELTLHEQLKKIPEGGYHAKRYSDDFHLILHLWDDEGHSFDIAVEKKEVRVCWRCDKKFALVNGMVQVTENRYACNSHYCKDCIPIVERDIERFHERARQIERRDTCYHPVTEKCQSFSLDICDSADGCGMFECPHRNEHEWDDDICSVPCHEDGCAKCVEVRA